MGKFKNVRKLKNLQSYDSNQVAWQRSANKDACFFRTSDILKLSYIIELGVNPIIDLKKFLEHLGFRKNIVTPVSPVELSRYEYFILYS